MDFEVFFLGNIRESRVRGGGEGLPPFIHKPGPPCPQRKRGESECSERKIFCFRPGSGGKEMRGQAESADCLAAVSGKEGPLRETMEVERDRGF